MTNQMKDDDARAGRPVGWVRRILFTSLILAAVALGVLYLL